MESTTINNETKEVIELFNEVKVTFLVKKKRELGIIFIKKKLFIIF